VRLEVAARKRAGSLIRRWLALPMAVMLATAIAARSGVLAPGQAAENGANTKQAVAPLAPYFTLIDVASGFNQPVFATHAGDGSGRLFILERRGVIKLMQGGSVLPTPFLDIQAQVGSGSSEQGLLGMAFDPAYNTSGLFYLYYTDTNGDARLSQWSVSSNPAIADSGSEAVLLTIPEPYANHNGGMIAFGPDGYLYIAVGDGGSGGDPLGNGQNLHTLLGKILRIDPDGAGSYSIPVSNPFVGDPDALIRDEIWAYGLRNPWRFSFDTGTGALYIADVGQSSREEINYQAASSGGGENYGWNVMEGTSCYQPSSGCDTSGKVLPVAEYGHDSAGGCSVSGGYVYRGADSPSLQGVYLYSDFCSGRVWGLVQESPGVWSSSLLADTSSMVSSFAQDGTGGLYLVDYAAGKLSKIYIRPFQDVDSGYWAFDEINAIYEAGYVVGCSSDPRLYCPDRILNRAESAVFVLRGQYGAIANPPYPAPSTPTFADVPASFWGYGWIESLWQDGFTAGCNTNPLEYCPGRQHTRAEGSVFFLRIKNGAPYQPPDPVGLFADVSLTDWYAGWVEAAYNQGLLPACRQSPLEFCPTGLLDRAWAAYMMVQAKGGLPLP
jgi:glucose/arabinose dehydrogenase